MAKQDSDWSGESLGREVRLDELCGAGPWKWGNIRAQVFCLGQRVETPK